MNVCKLIMYCKINVSMSKGAPGANGAVSGLMHLCIWSGYVPSLMYLFNVMYFSGSPGANGALSGVHVLA